MNGSIFYIEQKVKQHFVALGFVGFISNCTLAKNIKSLKKAFSFIWILVVVFSFNACKNGIETGNKHRGPIVLGDSASIVTETDATFLQDNVADLEPRELVKTLPKKKEEPAATQPIKTEETASDLKTARGTAFTIDFGRGAQVVFTGIRTQTFQKQNPEKDAGVSYAVISGNLSESTLKITGIKKLKVRQRYQAYLVLQSGNSILSLQNMGGYLSDWKTLQFNNSSVSLSDLKNPGFKSVSHNTIRTATSRAARSARLSKQKTNFWLQKIRNTRSVKEEPCQIRLDNVQWQISGQTNDGHRFFKTIRLDAKK